MRTAIPFLALLAAGCSPPPPDLTPITKELAALRQQLEDVKKAQQPTFDTSQAMEDLSKELRRVRDLPTKPTPPPPAVAVPIPTLPTGTLGGGVGGTQAGVNDLYWVLTRVTVDKEERVVLALYQAQDGGRGFRLVDVRMLNADLQIIQLGSNRPLVKDIVEALKKK